MKFPTLHLGGSNKDDLIVANRRAMDAIMDAIEALSIAHPNARDFYPQGEQVIAVAISEHEARSAKLEEVFNDLQKIVMHIQTARGAK
jgi:L-asparaginase II